MHALAPQIEEAVFEPHVLGIIGVHVDRERQRLGRALNFDALDLELDLAGRQLRVDRVVGALHHRAGDGDDVLEPLRVDVLEQRVRHVDDALRHAVMVAQIDEQKLAVVALAVDPAGKPRGLALVGEPELAAMMGAIEMHERFRWLRPPCRRVEKVHPAHGQDITAHPAR